MLQISSLKLSGRKLKKTELDLFDTNLISPGPFVEIKARLSNRELSLITEYIYIIYMWSYHAAIRTRENAFSAI